MNWALIQRRTQQVIAATFLSLIDLHGWASAQHLRSTNIPKIPLYLWMTIKIKGQIKDKNILHIISLYFIRKHSQDSLVISQAALYPVKMGSGQMLAGLAGSGKNCYFWFSTCLLKSFKLTRPSAAFGVWQTYKGIFEK